jgi:uncharacterized protein YjeT (DUF2065 family)
VEPTALVLAALGCALVLEGLPYFVTPAGARRAMRALAEQRDAVLRAVGLVLMASGLLLVWLAVRSMR